MKGKIYLIVGTEKDTDFGDVDFVEDWFATNKEANDYLNEYRKSSSKFRIEEVCKYDWEDFIKENNKYGWYK